MTINITGAKMNGFELRAAIKTDRGRKRQRNEDFVTHYTPKAADQYQARGVLFILADGVGGAAQGDRASKFAAEAVRFEYYRQSGEITQVLREVIRQTGNQIYQYAASNADIGRMATTLVAAVVLDDQLIVANVGDSRAYLIRNGVCQQITRDHNAVGDLMVSTGLSEEEAKKYTSKNRLTRSLGGEQDVIVDIFQVKLQAGDQLLLSSDGLTRYADLVQTAKLVSNGSPTEIVDRCVLFANQSGGVDNTSVIYIQVGEAVDRFEAVIQYLHDLDQNEGDIDIRQTVPIDLRETQNLPPEEMRPPKESVELRPKISTRSERIRNRSRQTASNANLFSDERMNERVFGKVTRQDLLILAALFVFAVAFLLILTRFLARANGATPIQEELLPKQVLAQNATATQDQPEPELPPALPQLMTTPTLTLMSTPNEAAPAADAPNPIAPSKKSGCFVQVKSGDTLTSLFNNEGTSKAFRFCVRPTNGGLCKLGPVIPQEMKIDSWILDESISERDLCQSDNSTREWFEYSE